MIEVEQTKIDLKYLGSCEILLNEILKQILVKEDMQF